MSGQNTIIIRVTLHVFCHICFINKLRSWAWNRRRNGINLTEKLSSVAHVNWCLTICRRIYMHEWRHKRPRHVTQWWSMDHIHGWLNSGLACCGCNRRATVASQIAPSHPIATTFDLTALFYDCSDCRFVVAGVTDRRRTSLMCPLHCGRSLARTHSLEDWSSGWAETADRDIKYRSFCPPDGDIRYYTVSVDN